MSKDYIVVWLDGTVGVLNGERASWSSFDVPVLMPFTVTVDSSNAPLSFAKTHYTKSPLRMFDGRPVFCADGYTLREAEMMLLVPNTEDDRAHADEQVRLRVDEFVKRHFPNCITLDARGGEAPCSVEMAELKRARCQSERWCRLLIAVKS